tara:strand:- start:7191 stop:7376 length:186 start_codon:yes stop_codon:yes gene_type:complete
MTIGRYKVTLLIEVDEERHDPSEFVDLVETALEDSDGAFSWDEAAEDAGTAWTVAPAEGND